jgi:hypothetical protein
MDLGNFAKKLASREQIPKHDQSISKYRNRLQKNMYGGGYHEVMDYGASDALPNPGYGTAA